MRKHLIGIGILILFTLYLNSILTTIGWGLIIKYVLYFIILTYITIILVSYTTTRLLSQNVTPEQESKIIILRSAVFVLSITLILIGEVTYINKNEVLYDYSCQYYDEYNNLVHTNFLYYDCSDLVVTSQTEEEFVFYTYKEMNLQGAQYFLYSLGLLTLGDTDHQFITLRTDTTIEYNDDHHITYFNSNVTLTREYELDGATLYDYYSQQHLVENIYQPDYFETTNKTGLHKEEGNTTNTTSHYAFTEEEYRYTKLYTTDVVLNTAGDPTYDIIKETKQDETIEQTTLFNVMKFINVEGVFSVTFMQEIEGYDNAYFIYDYDAHSQIGNDYIRISAHNQGNDEDLNFYVLDYEKDREQTSYKVFYQSGPQGLNIPFEGSMSYYQVQDPLSQTSYYTNDKYIFEFVNTDYGQMVVQQRKVHYGFFESVKEKPQSFITFYDYRYIQDWEHELTKMNLFVPQVIMPSYNPFTLE